MSKLQQDEKIQKDSERIKINVELDLEIEILNCTLFI